MGADMTKIKFAYVYATFAVLVTMLPVAGRSADDGVRGKFVFDGLANCENPPVQNFPVHAEGTASLSADRSARVDMVSNIEGVVQYNAKLGGKPIDMPNGSGSLHVAGRHTLRAVRDFPNYVLVISLTIVGHSCSAKVENRLKPGKRQYTFHTAIGLAYCSKPQVAKAECSVY